MFAKLWTNRSGKNKKAIVLKSIILPLVVVYAGITGYMYVFQRSFVFVTEGELNTPEEKGLKNVQLEYPTMQDGTKVMVWKAEPTVEGAPTVLYLHGNAGTVSRRANRFEQILNSGYGLYVPAYRGYPGSEGSPSETAIISDAIEHFDRVRESTDNIVIHGESLGTGVATAVAVERNPRVVILEAPYTAIVDIAAKQYPLLPVPLLIKDTFLTRERIKDVTDPLLIVHGGSDSYIPVSNGQKIFQLANQPKEIFVIKEATHSNLWDTGLWDAVLAFLKNHPPPSE